MWPFTRKRAVETTRARVEPRIAEATPSPFNGDVWREVERGLSRGADRPSYALYRPLDGVRPKAFPIAQDSAIPPAVQNFMNNAVADGVAFMGYPRLAAMAQRAEYRHIVGTLAEESTREWIEFRAADGEDKSERLKDLRSEFTRLKVRDRFRQLSEYDGFYGLGMLYLDTGLPTRSSDLATPLLVEPETIGIGALKSLRVIDPIWISPNDYNAADPLKSAFYRPSTWWVQGANLHESRLLRFVSRDVPDILKPSYNFGGMSLAQMAKPYVDNWLRTRQSVADLINGCSIVNLKTDLMATMQKVGVGGLIDRVQSFIKFRSNRGVMLTDKEKEELQILSANLAGLDKLQAQALEQICVVAQMPLVKFTGISPSGLNASSDGEIRVWYDRVAAYQEQFFRPHLTRVMRIIMLSLWGEIDESIDFAFIPLWQMDDAAKAAILKTKADTVVELIEAGVVSPEEGRKVVADDPDSPFDGIDVDDVPPPPEDGDDHISLLSDPAAGNVGASGV